MLEISNALRNKENFKTLKISSERKQGKEIM
jgi:hypothetical protein